MMPDCLSGRRSMGRFTVNGGKRLCGTVRVSGSKNAALPMIFAAMTVHGRTVIENVPSIADVDVALSLLSLFGAEISKSADIVAIDATHLEYTVPPCELTRRLRASTYLIGAMLSRFGRAPLPSYGGCNFDARPIDMHLSAAASFGARLEGDVLCARTLRAADIYFDKISVGATVNAMLMAASAVGISRIYGFAREPHVMALAELLRGAGAPVSVSDECMTVTGAALSPSRIEVIPDMIEAGTYLSLSALTGSHIRVVGADQAHLGSFFTALAHMGFTVEFFDTGAIVLEDMPLDPVNITTAPYPAFPTDLAPVTAPLISRFGGRITEGVWHNRFGYLAELAKFGVNYTLHDGYADISRSDLSPSCAYALDLRGGAALLLAALAANGESTILGSEIIKRGYTDIVNKLSTLGADIKEEDI